MKFKDLKLILFRRFHMPKEYALRRTWNGLTIAEKAVFSFLAIIFSLSSLYLVWQVNGNFLIEVPTLGGTLTEGIIGNPRFINPVLAISEADRNLSALVYSGLVHISPKGEIENELADTIDISPDRRVYTVHISRGAKFHDGEPITADDVIFTIQKIVDPNIKSPKRGNWDGISVTKIDEETVSFNLKQTYAPFIYNLAIGIIPKHIWKNVSDDEFTFSQFNTIPVGSGPYQVEKVERNSGGIPDMYQLSPFDNVPGKKSYIKNLIFRFYPSEDTLISAYNSGAVESISGISPEKIDALKIKDSLIVGASLPRIFAVFFNQGESKVLLNKEIRKALDEASPKEEIIKEVFKGYAVAIDSPIPAGIYAWTHATNNSSTSEERVTNAKKILEKAGWQPNASTGIMEKKSGNATVSLSFSISTSDAPELRQVADMLIDSWKKLGAQVEVHVFETGDLNQNVIRPRNFEALLFGEVVGRELDLYPFWHSSQRMDPGLNIALYANSRADKLLSSARSESSSEAVEKNYKAFAEEMRSDIPAVFLYTPNFLYIIPKKLSAVNLDSLTVSQDRFLGVRDWYIETDKVWKIFIN